MLNPLRSEQEAFRFLLYVAVVVGRGARHRARRARAHVSADLELAERARAGGRRGADVVLRPGRPRGSTSKSSATDPVSDADREAERVIRELLVGRAARRRPGRRGGLAARRAPAAGAGSSTRSTAP